MGFFMKAEYEVAVISILIVLLFLLTVWIKYKIVERRCKKSCVDGIHEQFIIDDNYHYKTTNCFCGKKWKIISKYSD